MSGENTKKMTLEEVESELKSFAGMGKVATEEDYHSVESLSGLVLWLRHKIFLLEQKCQLLEDKLKEATNDLFYANQSKNLHQGALKRITGILPWVEYLEDMLDDSAWQCYTDYVFQAQFDLETANLFTAHQNKLKREKAELQEILSAQEDEIKDRARKMKELREEISEMKESLKREKQERESDARLCNANLKDFKRIWEENAKLKAQLDCQQMDGNEILQTEKNITVAQRCEISSLQGMLKYKSSEIDKLTAENDRLKSQLDDNIISVKSANIIIDQPNIIKLFRSLTTPEAWAKIEKASRGDCPGCQYAEDMMIDITEVRLDPIPCWECKSNPFHKDYSREKWEEARDGQL